MSNYLTRIPRFRVKLGSTEEIFHAVDDTNSGEMNDLKCDNILKSAKSHANVLLQEQLGILTVAPNFAPENTWIDTVLNASNTDSATLLEEEKRLAVSMIKSRFSANTAIERVANLNTENITDDQLYSVRSSWKSLKRSDMFYNFNDEIYKTTKSFPNNASFMNCVAKSDYGNEKSAAKANVFDGTAVRIHQEIASKYDTTAPHYGMVFGELMSTFDTKVNGTLYFEFTMKPAATSKDTEYVMHDLYKYYNSTEEIADDVILKGRVINLKLNADTTDQISIILQDNAIPYLISSRLMTDKVNNIPKPFPLSKNAITLPTNTTFFISIMPYQTGTDDAYIVVRSNLFDDAIVRLQAIKSYKDVINNTLSIWKKAHIILPAGKIRIGTFNISKYTFSFGKTKYRMADYGSSGSLVPSSGIYGIAPKDDRKESAFLASIRYMGPLDNAPLTLTGSILNGTFSRTLLPTDMNCDFSIVKSTTESFASINLNLNSLNTYYTPYLFKLTAGYDKEFVDPTGVDETWDDLFVKKLNINCSAEGTFNKIKRSGDITLSNTYLYRDGRTDAVVDGNANPRVPPWETTKIQEAIKIEFAWATQQSDGTFPADTALVWERIFTGFIRNPKVSKSGYGVSECTYNMVDRWKQIEDGKITFNKYYDGVSIKNTVIDLCKACGIPSTEIEFSPTMDPAGVDKDPVLPLGPNAYADPKYKFKLTSDIDKAINQVLEAYWVLAYFDAMGKLQIKAFEDAINATVTANKIIFSDVPLTDDPAYDNATFDVLTPWNNINSPTFHKDTDGVGNYVIVIGIDPSPNAPFPFYWNVAVDVDSIHDPTVTNYIGYRKVVSNGKMFYNDPRLSTIQAKMLLEAVRFPEENYTWKTKGNTIPPYTLVKFVENHIKTGVDPNKFYFVIGNDVSFNSDKLTFDSSMTAKLIRGLKYAQFVRCTNL